MHFAHALEAEHEPGVWVVEIDPSEADRIREQVWSLEPVCQGRYFSAVDLGRFQPHTRNEGTCMRLMRFLVAARKSSRQLPPPLACKTCGEILRQRQLEDSKRRRGESSL